MVLFFPPLSLYLFLSLSLHAALCDILTDPESGTVSQTGTQIGDIATYQCNTGFELIGEPTRTCIEINAGTTGFNGVEPFCRRTLTRVSSF